MQDAEDFKNGQVLLIDKPLNWTSFQVVNKLRWAIRKKFALKKIKVGHAGTLDPLATGLLVICTGKKTKTIDKLQAETKEYTGRIRLGETTPSYDLETAIDKNWPIDHISNEMIEGATKHFLGKILQSPPIFSAVKQDGVRLYEKARKGESVEVKKREVEIFDFEITRIEMPEVDFRVTCSKGTYIRSLAYDFGKYLESGAHLTSLRRTRSGDFRVDQAETIEQFLTRLESNSN
jgi:tRNA pseudouridine55 synthase